MSIDARRGRSVEALQRGIEHHLFFSMGRHPETASVNDAYLATALAVRDRLFARDGEAIDALVTDHAAKRVAYFSAEFLMGPQLGANLLNLDLVVQAREALRQLGFDLYSVLEQEEEPGLGNGGLGRLAACFLDSLATLGVPAIGYGIRYEFGIFDQDIRNGWQVEIADKWLRWGNPWEIARPDLGVTVGFGGTAALVATADGGYRAEWTPAETVRAIPHDTPVPGHRIGHCNTLRLWRAEAVEAFDVAAFNAGDYLGAVDAKLRSETISKVLYPNDNSVQGRVLRLKQQYFFVSSSLQDMLRMHLAWGGAPADLPLRWALQLNDTHPAIAVAELMRLLVDEHGVAWDDAWSATVRATGYTNHTLMPEALETWPVDLFAALLPRHMAIVYEIDRRLQATIRLTHPYDEGLVARLSIVCGDNGGTVRMANLACAASHAINGVSTLHSQLLAEHVLPEWAAVHPERFCSITNGVTPRRFLAVCNPGTSGLMTRHIGDRWISDLDELRRLERLADDRAFLREWQDEKHLNRVCLAHLIHARTGITVDPASLFDLQVKRIHEYKRQHLNVLHILTLYNRCKATPTGPMVPRTIIFGGKAAPAYAMAKLMIRLITAVADLVNGDPDVAGRVRVVFFPDFNVKHAQLMYPAADLSEQISTAGMEASGTGNMKMALNGALTIGTLDGANIEIRDAVGAERFFDFGLTADQVRSSRSAPYEPRAFYESDEELRAAIDLLRAPALTDDPHLFAPLVDQLLGSDPYRLMADFRSYVDRQTDVETCWQRPEEWARQSVLTVARMGAFSSDRSIREYCARVWDIPVPTTPKRSDSRRS